MSSRCFRTSIVCALISMYMVSCCDMFILRHCGICCVILSPGVCQCEDGWLGFSCAIAEQQPPTLVFIPSEICDRRRDDCSTVTVYGTGFANTETLTCHFIQVSKTQSIAVESVRCLYVKTLPHRTCFVMILCVFRPAEA